MESDDPILIESRNFIRTQIKDKFQEFQKIIQNIKTKEYVIFNCDNISIDIRCVFDLISLQFEDENSLKKEIFISRKARIMNFSLGENQKFQEIVLLNEDIPYFIKFYKIEFAVYKDEDGEVKTLKNKENEVFDKFEINEIFNDVFINESTEADFNAYLYKKSDVYGVNIFLNEPSVNISDKINNGLFFESEKTNDLAKKIFNFIKSENKIVFILAGTEKIGKTNLLLRILRLQSFLYFNFRILKGQSHNKRKNIIFKESMRLFINYDDYVKFIKIVFNYIYGYKEIYNIIQSYNKIIYKCSKTYKQNQIDIESELDKKCSEIYIYYSNNSN